MTNKRLLAGLLLVVIGVTLWLNRPVAKAAPQVRFKTIDNQQFQLSDFKGHPVIISFWATNCPACLKEIPDFLTLYQHFHPKGLEIIAVSMPYDIPSHIVDLQKRLNLPWPLVLDLNANINQAFEGVALIPTLFLISPQGQIIWQKTGLVDLATLRSKIVALL